MSGVLCFTSQDGPFADSSTEPDVSFIAGDDNPTFVYRNEQELEQVASRHDASSVLQPRAQPDASRLASQNVMKDDVPIISIGGHHPVHAIGPFWLCLGKIFNSTIVSVVLIVVTVAVSCVLGGVSVFLVKPSPYFDKSLDAFQVPNHESTTRLEAFDLAKQDIALSKIKKRSVDDVLFNDDDVMMKPQYSKNGNDAMNTNQDAINTLDLNAEHIIPNLLGQSNNEKLFMKYKTNLNLPPINNIHLMDHLNTGAPSEEGTPPERAQSLHRQRRNVRRYRTSSWKLQMVYIAQGKDDLNIFTPERLSTIHDVEMSIMKHERFTDFCSRNPHSFGDPSLREYKYCTPPNSLMTYFYPSRIGPAGTQVCMVSHCPRKI